MNDESVQIEQDTICQQCSYTVITNSVMHKIDGKYFCASCAEGIRNKWKEKIYDIE